MSHKPLMPTAAPLRDGLGRLGRWTVREGGRRRALALLGSLSVGDFFLPALPTQTSVIALGLLQPQRWLWIVLVFASASAVGAMLLSVLLGAFQGYAQQFGSARWGSDWQVITEQVRRWGLGAVLVAAALPTPPRLLTAATLLAGRPAPAVAAAIFVGRSIWLGAFLAVLVRAPHWLARVPVLGPSLARLQAERERLQTEPLDPETPR